MFKLLSTAKLKSWQKDKLVSRLFFVFVSLIILCGALNYHTFKGPQFYAGYINDQEMLAETQHTLQQEASLSYGRPASASENVDYKEIYRLLGEEEPDKAISRLHNVQSYKVEALMITVGKYDVVPVADAAAVEDVIAMVASAYLPAEDNVSLKNVRIAEQIDARPFMCHPEDLRDADAVAAILLRGTDRRETYLVSRGDSLSVIANDNNISIPELREANPQVEGDFLQVGDELSLILPKPLVNVITTEQIEVTEEISFNTVYTSDSTLWGGQTKVLEKGSNGSKEVIYEISRENGRETFRAVISSEVIREPIAQKVARETGNFIWPVQGGGRLTSPYGWRNGSFHAGIDIAASRGTSVLAAYSGVVVYVGRDGAYGNCIVLHHGPYYTRYAHNSENLVSMGQTVKQGDAIGRIGSTGRSTGNHLHFEIRTGGIYGSSLNPLQFLKR